MRLVAVAGDCKKSLLKSLLLATAFVFAFSPLLVSITPVEAAVAYDSVSHDTEVVAGATGNFSWTHTPVAAPQGVLVYVVQGTLATDQVTTVTYGSLTLTRVAIVCDRQGEPGCVYAYFGGADVPSGAQTVTVNVGGASGKHASAITYTANTDTRITNFVALSEDATNPSKVLGLFSKTSHVSLGLYSGAAAVTNITPSAGWTSRYEDDFGNFQSGFYTYDTVGTSDVTTGWTQSADDMSLLAVAVSEVESLGEYAVIQTPGIHEFIVPAGVSEITFKGWGAGGGAGGGGNVASGLGGGAGGAGGFAQGTIPVTPGETITFTVGVGGAGGAPGISSWGGIGGAGGGRTEVSRASTSLLVAPGGGGGGGGDDAVTTAGGAGGAGGNTTAGGNGVNAPNGASEANGASVSAGGTGGAGTFNSGTSGGLKTAGDGADGSVNSTDGTANNSYSLDDGDGGIHSANNGGGGGGGGGYYGGGGGGSNTSNGSDGGGGGVSYFATTTFATTSTAGSGTTPGNTADTDFNSSHAGGAGASATAVYGADGEHGLIVLSYQVTFDLSGTLYENDGLTPVTSTTTTITAAFGDTNYIISTTTDESGNYSFSFDKNLNPGTEWTARSAAGNDEIWQGVTYGEGLFVAVGPFLGGDYAMTSPDGINWTPRIDFLGSTVTYGNGMFVVAGLFGIITSPDGINWTTNPVEINGVLYEITYGNGMFVAVGDCTQGDCLVTSPDGIDWTVRTAIDNDDDWRAVTYGNGLFVAVASSGDDLVMTSPDGINWTARSAAGDDDSWQGVTYGNGLFVAVGDAADLVMTSPDGINWTARSAAGNNDNWQAVTYGSGVFIAVGYASTDLVMTSPDGINWTVRSAAGNDDGWFGVTHGNGRFVAVGGGLDVDDVVMTAPGGLADYSDVPLTLYVDDSSTVQATALSYLDVSTSTSNGIDLYQDTVRMHHAGDGTIEPTAVAFSDNNSDSDILFETDRATTTIGSIERSADLFVDANTIFIASTTLILHGDFTNNGSLDFAGTTMYLEGTDPTLTGSFVGTNSLDDVVVNPYGGISNWVKSRNEAVDDIFLSFIIYEEGKFIAFGPCAEFQGEGIDPYPGSCVHSSTDGVTWATSTLDIIVGYDWSDITYGEGRFVAVGNCEFQDELQDCIAYSEDGITWATSTSPNGINDDWSAVTYGNGTFVAVGFDRSLGEYGSSTAMYSSDGINWSTTLLPGNDDNWRAVTFGNGTFVAAGSFMNENSNYVMTSSDGITWTIQSAVEGEWNGITYGEGRFVAVGVCSSDGGACVMYSEDSITWATTTADENDDHWNNVTYGGGTFVAVGFSYSDFGGMDDTIMTSPDGIVWTTRGLSNKSFSHAAYGNGNFIAVGGGVAMAEPLVTFTNASTSDLTVFENKKLIINDPLSVDGDLVSNGVFVNNSFLYLTGANNSVTLAEPVIGNVVIDGDIEFLWNATTSSLMIETGGSFEPHNLLTIKDDYIQNGSVDFSGTDVYLEGVGEIAGNMTGSNSFEDVIIDATSWDAQTNPAPSDQWNGMNYGDDTFVAVGNCFYGDTACVMTSSDGVTWATTTAPDAEGGQWQDITYGNGLFVAVSSYSDGAYVMTSPDGINWTARSIPAGYPSNGWSDVTYGNGLFVVVGGECEYADYCVMTSPDGTNWTARSALGDNDSWSGVTYGNGLFVVVGGVMDGGADNSIMTSPDGITWTARSVTGLNESGWVEVVYGNGVFVSSDGFYVMTSPDGTNWTEGGADFGGGLEGMVYGDGLFMALLGNDGYFVTSPDGVTWTTHYSDVLRAQFATAYGNGIFAAIGRDIFTSSNTTSFQNSIEFSDLEIRHGSTIVSSSTIIVNGNYNNGGKLIATTSSEFILDGTTQQTVGGNMTGTSAFNNLTIINDSQGGASSRLIIFTDAVETKNTFLMEESMSAQFPAGSTSTLQHVDLQGSEGNEITLRSSNDGQYWYVDIPGTQVVEYVDVKDSYASSTVYSFNSINSGNNINWNFGQTGSTTIATHDVGQVSNAFSSNDKINEELFAFKLIPSSGTATVTELVINLSGAKKIETSSFSNISLFRDGDNDGVFSIEDQQVGGGGVMTLSGQAGTITFSNDFLLSSAQNFLVIANWTAPSNGAFLRMDLFPSGVSAVSEGQHNIFGTVTGIQHGRNNRGGGGGAVIQIGGEPPASPDVGGGDEGGGGELIGDNPDYKRPSANSGSWTTAANAYDAVDGTYAVSNGNNSTHNYTNVGLAVVNGATIDGIEVILETSAPSQPAGVSVELSWNGGSSWTTTGKSSFPEAGNPDLVVSLGGQGDTWGRAWTASEFTSGNFRVRVTASATLGPIQIDELRVRVYSSVSGGGGGGGGDI